MPRASDFWHWPVWRHQRMVLAVAVLLATVGPAWSCWADDRPGAPAGGKDPAVAGSQAAIEAPPLDDASRVRERVEVLIRQLGSPRYADRRAAARELRHYGADAFDLLSTATQDDDPEVAASARYLVRQITVRWIQNSDSSTVRALLRDYGDQSDENRSTRVEALAALPHGEGVPALCRIARFDRSPRISREAAVAVIRHVDQPTPQSAIAPETVQQELGSSTRVASVWLRQYAEQMRNPGASVAAWQRLIEEESGRLESSPDDTAATIVTGLLWNLAELHRSLDQQVALSSVVDRMMGLDSGTADETVIELLTWLTEHQLWSVFDALLSRHEARVQQSKRPLYYAALARVRQGKAELGEELAKKAASLDVQTALESFIAAKDLEEHSQFDWAVREYRRSIDKERIESSPAILARVYLANLLHDYEKHEQAADTLEPLVKAVQGDSRIGQLYANLHRYYSRDGDSVLPDAEALGARLHYFRACQYRQQEDWQRVREALETAIRFEPSDADVVIAMYRVPDADENWQQATRRRIRELTQQFQQEIDENPSHPSPYNQWAWLVSNTEGDVQQAIRYSHRSLELIPAGAGKSAGASFLDTLGRCYYAAGDLENAVKYQRQAVEKVDYMQVMQRQLALFESQLAAQRAKAPSTGDGEEKK